MNPRLRSLSLLFVSSSTVIGCTGSNASNEPEHPPATSKADSSDGWHHRSFTATDGSQIAVDYNLRFEDTSSDKPNTAYYAYPFWVSVSGPEVTEQSEIRVVVVDNEFTKGQCGMGDHWTNRLYSLDLQHEPEGHFSGELDTQGTVGSPARDVLEWEQPVVEGSPYCSHTWNTDSSVAVVVDGTWLEDPISEGHNFGVDLSR